MVVGAAAARNGVRRRRDHGGGDGRRPGPPSMATATSPPAARAGLGGPSARGDGRLCTHVRALGHLDVRHAHRDHPRLGGRGPTLVIPALAIQVPSWVTSRTIPVRLQVVRLKRCALRTARRLGLRGLAGDHRNWRPSPRDHRGDERQNEDRWPGNEPAFFTARCRGEEPRFGSGAWERRSRAGEPALPAPAGLWTRPLALGSMRGHGHRQDHRRGRVRRRPRRHRRGDPQSPRPTGRPTAGRTVPEWLLTVDRREPPSGTWEPTAGVPPAVARPA